MPELVKVAGDGTAQDKCTAARELGKRARGNQDVQGEVADAGGLAAFVALISHGTLEQRIAGAMAFGSVVRGHASNQLLAVGLDASTALLVLALGHGQVSSDASQEAALLALNALTHDSPALRQEVIKVEGIPALVELCRHTSLPVRRAAAAALCDLLAEPDTDTHVCKAQGVSVLIEIAVNGEAVPRDAALTALGASPEYIPGLMELMVVGAGTVKVVCLRSVVNIAGQGTDCQERVVAAGGIPAAIDLTRGDDDKIRELAAQLLGLLAENHALHQSQVAEAGGVIALVELMHQGSPGQKAAAASSFGAMVAGHRENQTEAGLAGSIAVLLELVQFGSAAQKDAALVALKHAVARHVDNQQRAMEQGAIDKLVRLLSRGSASQKEAAARALGALVQGSSSSQSLAGQAIPTLVGLLQTGSPPEQEAASYALGVLSEGHAGNRNQVLAAGGTGSMAQLAKSPGGSDTLKSAAALGLLRSKAKFNDITTPRLARQLTPPELKPLRFLK